MIEPMIPNGWALIDVDMSRLHPHHPETLPAKGTATLRRIGEGYRKFFTLSEEEQEDYALYVYGYGWTVEESVRDAVTKIENLLE